MKKFLTLFLAVLLAVGCFVPAYADECKATIAVSPDSIKAGETVTVSVQLPDSTQLATMYGVGLNITFDSNAFTFNSMPSGWIGKVKKDNANIVGCSWTSASLAGENIAGAKYEFKFVAKSDATGGTKNFSVEFVSKSTMNADAQKVAITGGSASTKIDIPLTGIELDKETVSVVKGATATLTATKSPSNTTDEEAITWSSSDASVATVVDGVVTGVKKGTATITATCGSFTDTCDVNVTLETFTVDDIAKSYTYTGNAIEPTVTVKQGESTVDSSKYTVTYKNNTNAGTATVTVSGKSDSNYDGCVVEKTFTIGKASNSVTGTPTISGWTYGENANEPSGSTAAFGTVEYKYSTSETGTYTTTVPTNAGTYYVKATVAGTGNYDSAESSPVSFTIQKAPVTVYANAISKDKDDADPELTYYSVPDGVKFTGELERAVGEALGEYNITQGTLSAGDNYDLTFVGAKFSICKNNIGKGKVEPIADVTYDGTAKTPSVVVKDKNGNTLEADSDYEVTYTNNVNAGTATVTVAGKGDYDGSATANFTIKPATLTDSMVSLSANVTYNGSAQKPTVTVKDGAKNLIADTDYTVDFGSADYKDAGKYTVSVSGKGNYSGKIEKTFEIKAKELTSVTVDSVAAQTFTGKAITPKLTVKDGTVALELNKDYTVAFNNNVNVGEAKADITLIGNYTGTIKNAVSFNIVQKDASDATIAAIADLTYTGKAQEPTPVITLDGVTLEAGTDYELSYAGNTNVGPATLTVTFKGNYTSAQPIVKDFKIVPAELTITVDDDLSKKYLEKDPEFTYQVEGLVNNEKAKDVLTGVLSRESGEEIGSYAIEKGTLATNGNYDITTFVSKNFTIKPNMEIKSGDGSSFTEKNASDLEFELKNAPEDEDLVVTVGGNKLVKDTDYTVDESGKVTIKASVLNTLQAGTYEITFSYENAQGTVTHIAQGSFTVKEDTSKQDSSDDKGTQKKDKPARTGDDATPVLFAVIVLVCAAALVVLLIVRKKKSNNHG